MHEDASSSRGACMSVGEPLWERAPWNYRWTSELRTCPSALPFATEYVVDRRILCVLFLTTSNL